MNRSRLAPGVSLVAVPGQGLAVRTADGAFLRVDTGGVAHGDLWAHLAGAGPDAAEGELGALAEAFARAGYLAPAADSAADSVREGAGGGATPPHSVLLLGAPVLTRPLAALLAGSGWAAHTGTPDDLAGVGAGHGVVWCLDGPVPPGLWDAADLLPGRGVGWLRCHREGHHLWVEPLAVAPGDVTSAHVRARRLAATPAHRELSSYWAGGARRIDGGTQLPSAAASFVAALLAAELDAWARGEPATRLLRRVDLRDLTVTGHVVLPVPDVAPMPDRAAVPGERPVPVGGGAA